MFRLHYLLAGCLFFASATTVTAEPASTQSDLVERLLDRIVAGEKNFLHRMQAYQPIMEIYVQTGTGLGRKKGSASDQYAIGRVSVGAGGLEWSSFTESEGFIVKGRKSKFGGHGGSVGLLSRGFAQMIVPDAFSFDRKSYEFSFQRREFLGEVRTLVFEVKPRTDKPGRFVGRIWVEERGARIVRFNGTYSGVARNGVFSHFDSWRINAADGFWAPAYIYIQDEDETGAMGARFVAQARLWNYQPIRSDEVDELTAILIEQEDATSRTRAEESTPLEAERKWRHEAQQNILRRLERAGLLAPRGPVDEVAETVVRNLMATNGLDLEIECRILLTTPLETFSIGQAIVISRGLLDVLPDEASLAMVLSTELAHAVLGHRINTMFGFGDLTIFDDSEILDRLRLNRPPDEVSEASGRAVQLLENSSYSGKLANAGLFLQALASRAPTLPQLIRSNFGNALASEAKMEQLERVAGAAPDLDEDSLDQIAALPLGSRVRLDPWSNAVSLRDVKPVEIRTAEDKLPFQITPFLPYLRYFEP